MIRILYWTRSIPIEEVTIDVLSRANLHLILLISRGVVFIDVNYVLYPLACPTIEKPFFCAYRSSLGRHRYPIRRH